MTLPSRHSARTRIRPAGASSVSSVTGSRIGSMPVSSSTVVTQIVLVPDIGGYSTCSMMTKPGVGLRVRRRQDQVAVRRRDSRAARAASACAARRACSREVAASSRTSSRPARRSTPPTMTRPGSPQACRSTAVIIESSRMARIVPRNRAVRVLCGAHDGGTAVDGRPAAGLRGTRARAGHRIGPLASLRRPLVAALILGASMTMAATRQAAPAILLSTIACWGSVIVLQIVIALAVIAGPARRTVGIPRALDLFFASHVPWSLWVLFSVAWAPVPGERSLVVVLRRGAGADRADAADDRGVLPRGPRARSPPRRPAHRRPPGDHVDGVRPSLRQRDRARATDPAVDRLALARRLAWTTVCLGVLAGFAIREPPPRAGVAVRRLHDPGRRLPRPQFSRRRGAAAVGPRARGVSPRPRRHRADQPQ